MQVAADTGSGELVVRLLNRGASACKLTLRSNQYFSFNQTLQVAARSETALRIPLAGSGRWYDFSLRAEGLPAFGRRFAGRVETGAASISDPAMYGPALGEQTAV